VRTVTETFVDPSRPTAASPVTPAASERALPTTVVYPDAAGRFPLVVLAHGYGGEPRKFSTLAATWARAGIVVAMPQFPLTNGTLPPAARSVADLGHQAGDVSAVIDRMLEQNRRETSPFFERIRADRIGVAGHSLGAATVSILAFDPCCERRIDAAAVFAGPVRIDADAARPNRRLPTLLVHGDADFGVPIRVSEAGYAALTSPKWFVALLGGDHVTPYEDLEHSWDTVVERTTTDFWRATLVADSARARRAAVARLARDGDVPGVATLRADPG
jgi:dienelactone hydrolase